MNPRPRSKHHPTPQRASGSGRTPEATVPSGTEVDDAFSPCRPRNLSFDWEEAIRRSEGARTFWYGPQSFR
eukprot:5683597-Pleurochrysis_carterae.AAC.1